jgi:hypothetical protein
MKQWSVQIPDWKKLWIQQFYFKPTYLGVLEGTIRYINQETISCLPEKANAIFRVSRTAVYFQMPTAEHLERPLPDFLCMALVTSKPVEDETYDEYTLYSRVVCCWFTNDLNRTVGDLIRDGIHPFPWEKYAENWGV